ncbi:MAG: GntR family transcriptional regulator [Alkalinema sp. CACIAM 70d]|nr:MAG: GntR family transcriptional regulator [Alkalinema sp. CACIAM 70d]
MNLQLIAPSATKTLYEQVAQRIKDLITEGTLQPGDRLPSVRKLHRQLSVSISTVLEAYRVLEDQGWIMARPQSGYFVKRSPLTVPAEPDAIAQPKQITPVKISLAFRISATLRDPQNVTLGAAVPCLDLLPISAINRLMGQVLRANPTIAHGYGQPEGRPELRQAIARRLLNAGCSLTPEDVIITNGTTEALYLSLRAVTQPGDTVAIESPTYYGLLEILESLHLRALEIPTHPKDGISLSHLETALQQKQIATCAIVSNFSNPLGSCMSDSHKKQLLDLFNCYDIPLIEDDVYGDLAFDGIRPKAIKAFDTENRVLYCASASKTMSPGLRIGWVVPGRYYLQIAQLKMAMNWTTGIPPQLAIAAFLANGGYDRHLRQMQRTYQQQVTRMTQAICDYFPAGTKVTRPKGGYVLWLELPPVFDAMQLFEAALSRHISIAPGNLFSPTGHFQNCLRLSCASPWSESIDRAMQTLGQLIQQQVK